MDGVNVLERLNRLDDRWAVRRTRLRQLEGVSFFSSGAMVAFAASQRWVPAVVALAVAAPTAVLAKREERRSAEG